MLTGIANPAPLEEYLRPFCSDLTRMEFPDHHEFTEKDFMLIRDTFLSLPTKRKAILTTEKDAMRLRNEMPLPRSGICPCIMSRSVSIFIRLTKSPLIRQ
jgi:tetraacyldisaccharide 4'-kinase